MAHQHILPFLLLFSTSLFLQVDAQAAANCIKSNMRCCTKYMSFTVKYAIVQFTWSSTNFLCDAKTDYGGWLIIQRQITTTDQFNRPLRDYKKGFGRYCSDYWIGFDHLLSYLAKGTQFTLRIDVMFKGKYYFAEYANFRIGSESDHFTLYIGEHKGNLSNSLAESNKVPFSATDKDKSSGACTAASKVGWWFKNCKTNNLNGKVKLAVTTTNADQTMSWADLTTPTETAESVEMKVRKEYP